MHRTIIVSRYQLADKYMGFAQDSKRKVCSLSGVHRTARYHHTLRARDFGYRDTFLAAEHLRFAR